MQISDLAEWVNKLREASVAPLVQALGETLDSFVQIGLGYLSLHRASGTLSGVMAAGCVELARYGGTLSAEKLLLAWVRRELEGPVICNECFSRVSDTR